MTSHVLDRLAVCHHHHQQQQQQRAAAYNSSSSVNASVSDQFDRLVDRSIRRRHACSTRVSSLEYERRSTRRRRRRRPAPPDNSPPAYCRHQCAHAGTARRQQYLRPTGSRSPRRPAATATGPRCRHPVRRLRLRTVASRRHVRRILVTQTHQGRPGPVDMYVVPLGLENGGGGGVMVGMPPGYAVPMDPQTPGGGLFQSLPSISAMQSAACKFYPPDKQQTADVKDDGVFQLMTSSSSSLPAAGDGYSHHHYETQHQQQQQDIGYGAGVTTSMTSLERPGPSVGSVESSFFPRYFGAAEMVPGYVPCQPAPVSVYCGGGGDSVLPSYSASGRASLDQFVNFDKAPVAASAAAVSAIAGGSYAKRAPYTLVPLGSTAVSEPTSSHFYNQHLQHHQEHHHQLNPHHHQSPSLPPHYYHHRLPYPTKQPPSPPPPSKSPSTLMPTCRDVTSCVTAQQPEPETDEINTRAVAGRVAAELKRYSVPQAVFAQLVLCRSQGTLSDLLRNPKPWSKLKSGRETFRRMWKWLQEPEYQRMSALRFAGRLAGQNITRSFNSIIHKQCLNVLILWP